MVKTLDLDKINSGENDSIEEKDFRLKLVCYYPISMVNGRELSSMFVRGSSKKEVINSNEKLMIFLHHKENLYSWVEGATQVVQDQPAYIQKINPDGMDIESPEL